MSDSLIDHRHTLCWPVALLTGLICLTLVFQSRADDETLEMVVSGLEPVIETNVRAYIGSSWNRSYMLSSRYQRSLFEQETEQKARQALRPFGYYHAQLDTQLEEIDEERWRLTILVEPGPPVIIESANVQLQGPGAKEPELQKWLDAWPLREGQRLDQLVWEAQKEELKALAISLGYLNATFVLQRIEADIESRSAKLTLGLETGSRAVMGEVGFQQDWIANGVLESIPRFEAGEPYRVLLVDRLRTDLWRSGYFDQIDVVTLRRLDQDPPVVDLQVGLTPRKPHTQQITLGYGTDTQIRGQYRWNRHLLSDRGDSLGAGVGWQQRFDELRLFGEYRLPIRKRPQQYWLVNSAYRSESQDLELNTAPGENVLPVGAGRIDSWRSRFGKVKLINLDKSQEQITQTLYAETLLERDDFDRAVRQPLPVVPSQSFNAERLGLGERTFSLSLGIEYDWPVIMGKGFLTEGHHERAWLFTSNDAWGSDREFTQVYFSSRYNRILGQRWKLLLRGEVGYTDARVEDIEVNAGGQALQLSVTELPYFYRFRAGGNQSVRGYDFEQLSNNGIGSNHVFTASAELEFRVSEQWSGAAFFDIGNAFNDWNKRDLKRGVGLGVRWYTLAGAIRLDYAQGLDLPGDPWQIHVTIGTPLL